MNKFNSKLENIPVSIFSVITNLAYKYNATNLGQGYPDFNGPEWIFDYALTAMKEGKNQYAPSYGINSLRNSIAGYQKQFYDIDWNSESEIIITAGATEALFDSINALINSGDEVILFEPYYDSYYADVILAGGVPKFVTLKLPNFSFDFDELESQITTKTKLIILNNPHNPTGKVFDKNELEFISQIAKKYNLWVISDEVYEFLTFDNIHHTPISTFDGMQDRTITISSCGKTFGFTGWKIGYAIARKEIIDAIHGVHQWTTFAVNTPAQHSMSQAFQRLDEYLPDFRKLYEEKRNFVYTELLTSKFKPIKPYGSYFLMMQFPDDLFKDDIQASEILIKEFGIATIPPSVFYSKSQEGKHLLRLCFAKTEETLKEGIKKLKNV
jgi:N-succinyldiaminopimelate aminotransferase